VREREIERDTTVPHFNPPAEPARTVGFGKRDSARTVGFGKRDSVRTVRFGNQAASARERDLTMRERERLGVGSETASLKIKARKEL
jgi:hypothetical protein